MCEQGIYHIIELDERYNFAFMTFDLEGQRQGQIVKRLFFYEICKIGDLLGAEVNSSDTFDLRDPIFCTMVAHKWVPMGCQKNIDRMPPGELVNF